MDVKAPPIPYAGALQRDLVAEDPRTCPTCGGRWGKRAIRVCRRCGQPIARNEKYRLVPAGPGIFALEHRHSCGGGK